MNTNMQYTFFYEVIYWKYALISVPLLLNNNTVAKLFQIKVTNVVSA
jgi:hypothetical protein